MRRNGAVLKDYLWNLVGNRSKQGDINIYLTYHILQNYTWPSSKLTIFQVLFPLLSVKQTTILSGMQIIFIVSDQILSYSQTFSFLSILPLKYGTTFWHHKTSLSPPVKIVFTDRFKAELLLWILDSYLCFVFVMFSCLFIAALWSPVWKRLAFWLSCV